MISDEEIDAKLSSILTPLMPKTPKRFKIALACASSASIVAFIACLLIVYQYTQRYAEQSPAPAKAIAIPVPVNPAPVKVKPAHKPHKHKPIPVIVTAKVLPVEDNSAFEGHLDEDIFEVEPPLPQASLKTKDWAQLKEEDGGA